jgi:hypothetical protein
VGCVEAKIGVGVVDVVGEVVGVCVVLGWVGWGVTWGFVFDVRTEYAVIAVTATRRRATTTPIDCARISLA